VHGLEIRRGGKVVEGAPTRVDELTWVVSLGAKWYEVPTARRYVEYVLSLLLRSPKLMFFWDYPEISVSGFARIDGQNNVSALITNAPNNGRELWQVKPDSVVLVSETALDNLGSNAAGLIPLYVYPGQQGNYGSMFWTHVYQNNNTYNCDFRQPNSRNVGSVRSMCAKGFILDDAAFDQLNSLQTKTSLSIQITTDGVTIYLPNSGDGIHVGAKGNGPVSITGTAPESTRHNFYRQGGCTGRHRPAIIGNSPR
jgi:hypothetical protein